MNSWRHRRHAIAFELVKAHQIDPKRRKWLDSSYRPKGISLTDDLKCGIYVL
jgi:hypothetical protein